MLQSIPELSSVDLYAPWYGGFPKGTVLVLAALVLIFWRMAAGYRDGIVLVLGRFISLVITTVFLYVFSGWAAARDLWHPGRPIAAVLYLLLAYISYQAVCRAVTFLGKILREIPIIGWVDGVFGAFFGCAWAVLTAVLVSWLLGFDLAGMTEAVLARLDILLHNAMQDFI